MRLRPRALLFPIALLVAACGHGASDREQALNVIRDYVQAMDRGDRFAECRLLSPRAQRALVETVQLVQTDPAYRDFVVDRSRTARTCPDALEVRGRKAHRPDLSAQPGAFDNLDAAQVSVRDGRATVQVLRVPLLGPSLTLVQVDGRWRIDSPEG